MGLRCNFGVKCDSRSILYSTACRASINNGHAVRSLSHSLLRPQPAFAVFLARRVHPSLPLPVNGVLLLQSWPPIIAAPCQTTIPALKWHPELSRGGILIVLCRTIQGVTGNYNRTILRVTQRSIIRQVKSYSHLCLLGARQRGLLKPREKKLQKTNAPFPRLAQKSHNAPRFLFFFFFYLLVGSVHLFSLF